MPEALDSPILFDGDSGFRALVTRLRPSQLKPGDVSISKNMRFEESGTAKVREGYLNVSGVVLSSDVFPYLRASTGTSAIVLIGAIGSSTGADQGSGRIRITTGGGSPTAHGIPSTGGLVNLSGFSGGTGTLNGNRAATYVTTTTFDVTISGTSGSWTGGTVGAAKLTGGRQAIYGACRFTNPNSNNDEYIIVADNDGATAVKLSDFTTTAIAYPSDTLTQDAQLQQEFDVVMLRQDGKTPWVFDPDDGSTGLGGTPAFTKVSSGTYTQPLEISGTATITVDGKVSFDKGSAHGLSTGDTITITDKSTTLLTLNDTFTITKTGANTLVFYDEIDDTNSGVTIKIRTPVSLGGGFQYHPASAGATYHNRRVWTPYTHDSAASPARRSPAIYDELLASDILDNSTFDTIYNQFRISGGTADFIVGLQQFDSDRLVVFNRNSIHQLLGTSGSLADVQVRMLTNEMGCLARKSIVYHAGHLFFLSDNGVMGVTFADALNLRGLDQPLSEAIDSEIKRINRAYADKAVSCVHDNKYWLAVPTGDSEVNNEIFIFNFLTQGWESIDSTSADNWGIVELIPARTGKVNELFAVTEDGGVHQLDQTGLNLDDIAPAAGASSTVKTTIPAQLRTRGYTHGTIERKRFQFLEAQFVSDSESASDGTLALITEDPDSTTTLGTIDTMLGAVLQKSEGGSVRARTGNPRGFSCQFDWTPSLGRPELRAVGVRATNTFNTATSTT